jgi:hypothetical protein
VSKLFIYDLFDIAVRNSDHVAGMAKVTQLPWAHMMIFVRNSGVDWVALVFRYMLSVQQILHRQFVCKKRID